jgi:hypothetical protein
MFEDRHPCPAMLIVMNIRATDTAAGDLYDNVIFTVFDFT